MVSLATNETERRIQADSSLPFPSSSLLLSLSLLPRLLALLLQKFVLTVVGQALDGALGTSVSFSAFPVLLSIDDSEFVPLQHLLLFS